MQKTNLSQHFEQNQLINVIGLGDEGWEGLSAAARQIIEQADIVLASHRHFALLDTYIRSERIVWQKPIESTFAHIDANPNAKIVVLASGDPLCYGIGSLLVKKYGIERLNFIPHISSLSLAAARLGWSLQDCISHSLLNRPLENIIPDLQTGNRLLVLTPNGKTPAHIAKLCCDQGFGQSRIDVLSHLGNENEQHHYKKACDFDQDEFANLNIVAIDCVADHGFQPYARNNLPDQAFVSDGQLTRREVRAVIMSYLSPRPHHYLWDIGGGSGSIAIEWMRSDRSCRATIVEHNEARLANIRHNAKQLGVPNLEIIAARAPEGLMDLSPPDAVFIGGGFTQDGLVDACWQALKPGGMMVASAVTLESQAAFLPWVKTYNGEMVTVAIQKQDKINSFHCLRPQLPIVLLSVRKPLDCNKQ